MSKNFFYIDFGIKEILLLKIRMKTGKNINRKISEWLE